jgi:molecular chaperone GrpE
VTSSEHEQMTSQEPSSNPPRSAPPDGQPEPHRSTETVAAAPPEADAAGVRRQLDEANERVLRVQAELENFRKRTRREMEDERRFAALPVLRDLLAVLDNLQRAIEAAEKSDTGAGLLDGVKMVAQQFDGVLRQHHCRRIEALGQPFDPHLHEAVGQEPSAQFPPGAVVRELRPGYLLHDRVLRPTQVFVSAAPPSEP